MATARPALAAGTGHLPPEAQGQPSMRNLSKACILVLDEVLVAALVLIVLWQAGVRLSPWVIATTVVVLGGWTLVLHKLIKSIVRRRQVGGREGMIGLVGKVVKPLAPNGVIRIHGELWNASCRDGRVAVDEDVVVTAVEGLKLVVKPRSEKTRQ